GASPTVAAPVRWRPSRLSRAWYWRGRPSKSFRDSPIFAIRRSTISRMVELAGTAGARTVFCPVTSLTRSPSVIAACPIEFSFLSIPLDVRPGDGLVAPQHGRLAAREPGGHRQRPERMRELRGAGLAVEHDLEPRLQRAVAQLRRGA